jgi:hypothetical protein
MISLCMMTSTSSQRFYVRSSLAVRAKVQVFSILIFFARRILDSLVILVIQKLIQFRFVLFKLLEVFL